MQPGWACRRARLLHPVFRHFSATARAAAFSCPAAPFMPLVSHGCKPAAPHPAVHRDGAAAAGHGGGGCGGGMLCWCCQAISRACLHSFSLPAAVHAPETSLWPSCALQVDGIDAIEAVQVCVGGVVWVQGLHCSAASRRTVFPPSAVWRRTTGAPARGCSPSGHVLAGGGRGVSSEELSGQSRDDQTPACGSRRRRQRGAQGAGETGQPSAMCGAAAACTGIAAADSDPIARASLGSTASSLATSPDSESA